jgi:hypothetical protein
VYFYSSSIIIMKIMHTICSYIYIVYKRQCFVPVPEKIYLTLCFCCEPTRYAECIYLYGIFQFMVHA